MSLYNYVDTPNTNLICCICRAPFTHPTTTLTCSHTFCSECILRALSHAPLCPVDRSPLGVGDLRSASPIVRAVSSCARLVRQMLMDIQMVDELLVECPYRFEGCESVKERQMMPLHLKEECCFAEGRVLAEESAGMSQATEEREGREDRAGGSSRARSASGNSEVRKFLGDCVRKLTVYRPSVLHHPIHIHNLHPQNLLDLHVHIRHTDARLLAQPHPLPYLHKQTRSKNTYQYAHTLPSCPSSPRSHRSYLHSPPRSPLSPPETPSSRSRTSYSNNGWRISKVLWVC